MTEAFAKIGAPLVALVGGGTIAGLYALTDGWARFGLQVSQTAQILGVNTQALYNFQNAARLIGVSGQTATATLQGFAQTLQDARWGRNQQAFGTLLVLGIHLKNTKSGSIDSIRALGDIAHKIHRYQQEGRYGAARTVARQLGLAALLPSITPLVREFGSWIHANRRLIATDIGNFVRGLGAAFRGLTLKNVLDDILAVVRGMLRLVTDIASVTASLEGLKTVLETVGVLWGISKIEKFGLAIWRVTGYVNAARKAYIAWRAARGLATAGEAAGATGAAGLAAASGIGLLGGAAVYGGAKWWERDQLAILKRNRMAASGMAPEVMRFFERRGWTEQQAAGIAANIQTESGFNPRAGLFQAAQLCESARTVQASAHLQLQGALGSLRAAGQRRLSP